MRDGLRLLSFAAAFSLAAGIGAADAQTLVVRNAPPETSVELVMNTDAAGSAKVGASGVGLVVAEAAVAVKANTDAQIFVDVCDKLYRVAIVRRGFQPAPQESGCVRRDMGGLFLIRPITTLVIDVAGPSPTLLLRQGRVSLDPPRTWSSAPTGLILFAGGGFSQISSITTLGCGTLTECSGDDSGAAFTAGGSFWISPYIGGEASYFRPAKATVQGTAEGSAGEFRFNSTFGADVFTAVGKIGGPAGRTRLYGLVGATYQISTFDTTETLADATPAVTQTYRLKTNGFGWMFGGGMEIWLAPALAIYGEGGRAWLKGTAGDDVDGRTDAWMTFIVGGVRVRLGG